MIIPVITNKKYRIDQIDRRPFCESHVLRALDVNNMHDVRTVTDSLKVATHYGLDKKEDTA